MKLGLFTHGCEGTPRSGPYKVIKNLVSGLKALNVEIKYNTVEEYNGCLNNISDYDSRLPSTTLLGPNLFVYPTDNVGVWKKYTSFVVPSEWVKNLYYAYPITRNNKIYVWPVGIDTDDFCERKPDFKRDCFIYFKNSGVDLNSIKTRLDKLKLTYSIINYGEYNETQFKEIMKTSKFCILMTGTESQGIAYMEMLSSNVPIFVINATHLGGAKASSVPYFSANCGIVSNAEMTGFNIFLNLVDKFNPRKYILENHTLKMSAQKYINFIIKAHDEKPI